MIARLARPLVPVLWRIEDRESTSRGMEELGSSIRRESYPSFWFLLASEWRPEYDPVLVSGLSECVNIRFCIYLLGINCIPESTEPPIDTHELVFSTRNIYDISPVKFPRICTENLTPSSVVYKILGNVLSEDGVHGLVEDRFKIPILRCNYILSAIPWLNRMNHSFWNNTEISTYVTSYISVYLQ